MIEKMLKKLEELNIESQSCSECAYIKECDAMQEKYDIPDNVCLCTMLMKLKAKEIVQEVAKEYCKDGQDPCIGCRYEKRLNAQKCDFCSRPRKDYYEPKKAPYQKGE